MKRKTILASVITLLLVVLAFVATDAIAKRPRHARHHRHARRTAIHKPSRSSGAKFDGIDVSHHNTVNWAVLAKNNKRIRFAYIKAVEGRTHKDPKFKNNVREARKQGIAVGAYLLYSMNSTPQQQYQAFISMVDGAGCNLIPAIDVEKSRIYNRQHERVAKDITILSNLLQKHYGRRPLLYCHEIVYDLYLRKRLPYNLLWICDYRHRPKMKGRKGFIWQYSNHTRIKGVAGFVDADIFQGQMNLNMLRL